jgi:hypothetical protein
MLGYNNIKVALKEFGFDSASLEHGLLECLVNTVRTVTKYSKLLNQLPE